MAGIYIHVPFCKQACHYCNFHFSTLPHTIGAVVEAIGKEIVLQRDYLGGVPIQTIYVGGGTPSLLPPHAVGKLFELVRQHFSIMPDAEITLEANPDDVSKTKLTSWRSMGINRLSIGVQSFQNVVLKFLNRAHDARAAIKSIQLAQEVGFDNVSVDLMYAIPGLSHALWTQDVHTAAGLGPVHVAAYCLTIEPRTVFGHRQATGQWQQVEDEFAADQYTTLIDTLAAYAYDQYEVSNFCKTGRQSQHNLGYWSQQPYLGIGPGAHSYNGHTRQHNLAHNVGYVKSLREDILPTTIEVLQRKDHINEYIMTRLRTLEGCDLRHLKRRYQHDVQAIHGAYLDRIISRGWAQCKDEQLQLCSSGLLLADKVAMDLFVD